MKGMLEYVLLCTYKDENKLNPYAGWTTLKEYSFASSEEEWLKTINKLSEMGLVEIKKDKVISKSKLKEWHKFETREFILNLHGKMNIDCIELFMLKKWKAEKLRDLIYIGLVSAICKGRNYSRKWIEKMTGYTPYMQKQIEKNNKDLISVNQRISSISDLFNENDLLNKKVFPAYADIKNKTIKKTKVQQSNTFVVQQGNNCYVKENIIFSLDTENIKIEKYKNKSAFYKVLNTDIEVKANDFYDAVFSEEKHRNVRSELFFSNQVYNKFAEKKLIKVLDFNNTAFVTSKGELKSLTNVLKTI